MKVERIDRIAVAVHDIDKAIAFFSDLLGIEFDLPVAEPESIGLKGVYSSLGLELVAPLGRGPDWLARSLEKRGQGVNALVIKVNNLEEAVAHFQSRGVQPVSPLPPPGPGLREVSFHPKDTFGVQIILCDYQAPHPATCAARHHRKGQQPSPSPDSDTP